MIKRQLIGKAAIAITAAMVILSGCGKDADTDATESSISETTTTTVESSTSSENGTKGDTNGDDKTDDEKKPVTEKVENGFPSYTSDTSLVPTGETVRSFLTGEWINDTVGYRRPLAVMINNIEAGLPQSGISKADVIFEGQCEGGVTRLMEPIESISS